MLRSFLFLAGLYLAISLGVRAQAPKPILPNAKAMTQVKVVMDAINSHDFAQKSTELQKLKGMVGDHPICDLLDGLSDYWQHYPVYAQEDRAKVYRTKLFACQKKAGLMLDEDAKSIEGTFFTMLTDLMLAKHFNDRGESVSAINYTRRSFSLIKKGFELKKQYVEFYFTTGLYDYFREAIPEKNPVYKTFMWMFPEGNKVRGLEELEIAFKQSTFTRADAAVFLTRIYMFFENNATKAQGYAKTIHEEYPENPHYQVLYAEALLASGKGQEAEAILDKVATNANPYFKSLHALMHAWQLELTEPKTGKAGIYAAKALDLAKAEKGRQTDNLKGVNYIILARAWAKAGDKAKTKQYYTKAAKLVTVPAMKAEAEKYLDS